MWVSGSAVAAIVDQLLIIPQTGENHRTKITRTLVRKLVGLRMTDNPGRGGLLELFEAIEKRHSYRGPFEATPVPREDLRKIVQAGIQAPSGYNGQSTSFIIVDDPKLLEQMGDITNNAAIKAASAAVVAVADPQATADKEFSFSTEDYSAAAENMLLAITALGYGSVWVDGILRRDGIAEKVGDLLGVPSGRTVRVIFPVGVPSKTGSQNPKKPFADRAWFNGWQKSC